MSDAKPAIVAWEVTKQCAMKCAHCRADAHDRKQCDELTNAEACRLIDRIADGSKPLLLLSGGDPLMRADIFDLAARASSRGLRVAMAPCGHGLNADVVKKIRNAGIHRISISLDGINEAMHDDFRSAKGDYQRVMNGLGEARKAGLPFQVNTTVSRHNSEQLEQMIQLAASLGAECLDFFFLVPTGRASSMAEYLEPADLEQKLRWIIARAASAPLPIKTTCAPYGARLACGQHAASGKRPMMSGCMAGRSFVFISHAGLVQPCGFLDVNCGDLRKTDFDLWALCMESETMSRLKNADNFGGKCGICEYRRTCGGCRARAYAQSGDFSGEDPACTYLPLRIRKGTK